MKITLVNLMPHVLSIDPGEGPPRVLEPAGPAARVAERRYPATLVETELGSVPLISMSMSDSTSGLPAPRAGVLLVVSRLVALALPDRDDLLFPVDELRDKAGRIVGCRGLGRLFSPVSTAPEK